MTILRSIGTSAYRVKIRFDALSFVSSASTAIVASAVEVLNRKGVRGMTLGEVAASLNLVPTGVIYYFKNKEDLAAACFLKGVER